MIRPRIQYTLEHCTITCNRKHNPDQRPEQYIVPMVVIRHLQIARDQDSAEDGAVQDDDLPEARLVSGPYLHVCIEPEEEEAESSKSGFGVTGGKGYEGVLDGSGVAGADVPTSNQIPPHSSYECSTYQS